LFDRDVTALARLRISWSVADPPTIRFATALAQRRAENWKKGATWMRKPIGLMTAAALAIATAGLSGPALARPSNPGGLFNFRLSGYEMVTEGATSSRLTLKGVGTIHSDPSGNLTSGVITISSNDGSLPEASPVGSTCTGTATGTISGAGNQIYNISLAYTDSANSGQCLSQALAMTCVRSIGPKGLAPDLAAGGYGCVVTGVSGVTASSTTIDGASLDAHFGAQTDTSSTP
jgi:hypothetical protein